MAQVLGGAATIMLAQEQLKGRNFYKRLSKYWKLQAQHSSP